MPYVPICVKLSGILIIFNEENPVNEYCPGIDCKVSGRVIFFMLSHPVLLRLPSKATTVYG